MTGAGLHFIFRAKIQCLTIASTDEYYINNKLQQELEAVK
jgi:hypothetical protein